MQLTAAHLRYLLAIYEVSRTHLDISSRSIAEKLGVTKPSVVRILNLLMEQGMIVKEYYGKIYLTDRGIWVAKRVQQELDAILAHFPPVSGELTDEEQWNAALAMTSALPQRLFHAARFLRHARDGNAHPVQQSHGNQQGNAPQQPAKHQNQRDDRHCQQYGGGGQEHGAFPQIAAAPPQLLFHPADVFADDAHRVIQPCRVAQQQIQHEADYQRPNPIAHCLHLAPYNTVDGVHIDARADNISNAVELALAVFIEGHRGLRFGVDALFFADVRGDGGEQLPVIK